ncbi:MAG: PQQ-binding-like beta-propeller repeat protein, partial [Longimicrobiales bacterium]
RVWRTDAGGPVTSAPAVDDTRVYAAHHDGTLVAVGRHDGAVRWRSDLGPALPWAWGLEGWDYLGSSPVLGSGLVVVGSADGRVRAVDADTGAEVWAVATGGRVRSSPAMADGTVYVGSADGSVRALVLATGAERWRFESEGVAIDGADFGFDRRPVTGGPSVADGQVYVGSRDARMYALDAVTGRLVWSHDDDGASAWVISTPAVWNDLVIFGRSSSAKVQAVDAATGALRWEVTLGGPVFSSPVVADGRAYVTTGGAGELVALDAATGAVQWRRRLGAESWSTPAVLDGVIVAAADDGVVRAIDATEGASPMLAVFRDSVPERASLLNLDGLDGPLASALARRGYESLDAETLPGFLEARIGDGAPSAIVFATDALPSSVAPDAAPRGLLVDYLGAGGTVVWVGDPPFWLSRDADSGAFATDIEAPAAFLGVDFGEWIRDSRVHRPTPAGRDRGLRGWWTGPGGVVPAQVTTVLATDDEGRASAWVKSYGGRPGAGWVALPYRSDPEWIGMLTEVAETGVWRRMR